MVEICYAKETDCLGKHLLALVKNVSTRLERWPVVKHFLFLQRTCSVSSMQMVAYKPLWLSSIASNTLFWPPFAHGMHVIHRRTCWQSTYACQVNKSFFKRMWILLFWGGMFHVRSCCFTMLSSSCCSFA